MKSKLLIAFALSIGLMNSSLGQVDPNIKLKKDLQKYKDMKDGGMAMIVVGSVLMLTGGIFEASQWNDSFDSWAAGEPEKEYSNAGVVMVCLGGGLLGAGIPLTISGRKKYRELRNSHPEIISLGIKKNPTSTGVGLTVRF